MAGLAPDPIPAVLSRLAPFGQCWVAYSGGLDSTALLHALLAQGEPLLGRLRVVHLDHGLHPRSADWAEQCRRHCESLGLPFRRCRLGLRPVPGASLEAVAREARYRAFASLLEPGDLVATAHHRDDQAETLLLALLRGSGVHGLAAMPVIAPLGQGRLVRPLLDVSRATLESYVRGLGLSWIDDPSNALVEMDRNYLRHRVLPLLHARWPGVSAVLARSAGHCAEAASHLDGVATDWLTRCAGARPGTLSRPALLGLERPQCKAVLRLWLRRGGFGAPNARLLDRILDEVLPARADADPVVSWRGCAVRRYRDQLFALPPLPPSPAGRVIAWSTAPEAAPLRLPDGLGWLQWSRAAAPSAWSWPPGEDLTIRFAPIGQSCRARATGPRRPLKKLFQDAGIPPWLRHYIPMLFVGEALVAIAGLCGCSTDGLPGDLGDSVRWTGHPWEGLGFFRD